MAVELIGISIQNMTLKKNIICIILNMRPFSFFLKIRFGDPIAELRMREPTHLYAKY
jgi:hypothetical protein